MVARGAAAGLCSSYNGTTRQPERRRTARAGRRSPPWGGTGGGGHTVPCVGTPRVVGRIGIPNAKVPKSKISTHEDARTRCVTIEPAKGQVALRPSSGGAPAVRAGEELRHGRPADRANRLPELRGGARLPPALWLGLALPWMSRAVGVEVPQALPTSSRRARTTRWAQDGGEGGVVRQVHRLACPPRWERPRAN